MCLRVIQIGSNKNKPTPVPSREGSTYSDTVPPRETHGVYQNHPPLAPSKGGMESPETL